MLVIARKVPKKRAVAKPFHRIEIGRDIIITVLPSSNGGVKIGVEAPREINVSRGEHLMRGEGFLDWDDETDEWIYIVDKEVLWREASKQEAESRLDLQDAAREV